MQRFREGIHIRTMKAKRKVEEISKEDIQTFLKKNAFVLFTVGAVIAGIILGFALRPYKMSYREVKYFSFPGELLMRMLQMLVLPLLVSSLITGMAALDSKASGKMGMRAVIYYMTTTFIAVFIGILIVLIIHPGKGSKEEFGKQQMIEQVSPADAFLDLIRNMFPPNLVQACTQQFKTKYGKRVIHVSVSVIVNDTLFNTTNGTEEVTELTREEVIPVPGQVNGVNALGLVVFSMCFGLIIGNMKEHGQLLRDFFDSLNEAIMQLVALIMWYAPIGILFLIAGKIVEMDDLTQMGGQLGMYTITVIIGLMIHAILILPTLYFVITRQNPFIFIAGLLQALVTALGTSSSDRLRTTTNVLGDSIGAGIIEFLSRHELRSKDVEMGNSVLSFNVSSALCLTAGVLQAFPKQSGLRRCVINVSSLCALKPFASWVLYCSGKAARDMMFKVLAEEESDLRVLNYAPGQLDTDMQAVARTETRDSSLRKGFSDMFAEGQLLTCEASCAKLMKLLLEDKYKSGDHIDFYDV